MEEIDEVWENESRMFVSKPWGTPSSITRFTDLFGKRSSSSNSPSPAHQTQATTSTNTGHASSPSTTVVLAPTVPVPLGYIVTRDWAVDKFGFESGLCDELGWSYGELFLLLPFSFTPLGQN
jgi:hypothetical protein